MTPGDRNVRDRRSRRSRSPNRDSHLNRRRRRSRSRHSPRCKEDRLGRKRPDPSTIPLPFHAQLLSKHDLADLRPMFGLYLDIQKHRAIDDLKEEEGLRHFHSGHPYRTDMLARNSGELAEGWYKPKILEKARRPLQEHSPTGPKPRVSTDEIDEDSDDTYGPALPTAAAGGTGHQHNVGKRGPSRAALRDLQVKHEVAFEETEASQRYNQESIRIERRAERRLQAERLDEIAPRAEAGTRERQLEKRREKAVSNRTFAASAHDGADLEVPDSDMMGGGDGIDDLKRLKQAGERKRSEREIQREEQLAARRAEREDRVQFMKAKEEETMSMLKDLAKARFGGGA